MRGCQGMHVQGVSGLALISLRRRIDSPVTPCGAYTSSLRVADPVLQLGPACSSDPSSVDDPDGREPQPCYRHVNRAKLWMTVPYTGSTLV